MLKKIAKFALIILGILLLIYLAGYFVFTKIFLPNTQINGKDYSLMPKANLAQEYKKSWENYSLQIEGRGGRMEAIKAKDFSYEEILKGDQSIDQKPHYWPIYSLMKKDYKLDSDVKMDQAKLDTLIQNLKVVSDTTIKDPTPDYIGYEVGKGYVIIPGDPGDRLDVAKFKKAMLKSFSNQDLKLDLDKAKLYLVAPVEEGRKNMENHVKSLNELDQFSLSFNFSDRIETLGGQDLINLHSQDEDGYLQVDQEKLSQYVDGLSAKYDTFRGTRDFAISGGGMVRIKGGIYGWQTDKDKTSQLILEAIQAKETKELTPIYSREAVSRNVNDIGSSYIEIDLARQHMWLYKEGKLVIDTPVVTGDPTKGNGTPTGTSVIWSMETGRYLTGSTWKSWVNYWMPFNWTGCGIHDSSWRSSYGGSIYLGGGSHGCVNTPPGKAKVFFQQSFKGMPVVIYNSNTQKI